MSAVETFMQAKTTYERLAEEKRTCGKDALSQLISKYVSAIEDSISYYMLSSPKLSGQVLLPHQSQSFSAKHITTETKAVLFDMYMTLVELRSRSQANMALAAAMRVSPEQTASAYKQFASKFLVGCISPYERMKGMASAIGRAIISDDEIHHLMAVELKAYIGATSLYPGVKEMIASYRRQGLLIGIVSNASPWGIEVARHYGLIDLVDVAGFSADPSIVAQKPFPKIYEYVCSRLGVEAPQCVFVDDGGSDFAIEGAQLLGMTALRVDHPGAEQYRPVTPLSHFHIGRIAEMAL